MMVEQPTIPFYRRAIRRASETHLRVLYWLIALVSFSAIVTSLIGAIPNSMMHTDDCLWETVNVNHVPRLMVTHVIPGGNADRAGVRTGDIVVAIGERDLTTLSGSDGRFDLNIGQDALQDSPIGVPIRYVVERNGRILFLQIVLTKQFLFFPVFIPVLSLLWLVIGLTVLLTRPRGRVQQQFFLTTACVIFAFSFPTVGGGLLPAYIGIPWSILSASFFIFWLRFFTVFPIEHEFMHRGVGRTTLSAASLLMLAPTMVITALYYVDVELPPSLGTAFNYMAIALRVLCFGGGIVLLHRGYRHLPALADRRPVTVILIGSILAGVALIYTMIIQSTIAGVAIMYPQYLLPVLLLLALPVSFGYAVFRYQVMDLGRVVKTTLVYTATMALIAGLYLAVGYGVGRALGSLIAQEFKGTVEVLSFVLFVMVFEPVKRKVQTAIENRFFPQRRDYSGRLATYSAEITETIGAQAVAERTAATLQSALDLRGVCVAIEDPNDNGMLKPVARASEFAPVPVDTEAVESLRHQLRQTHNLILLETVSDPKLEALQMYFPYIIGMYAQGRVTGAILMSRPHDEGNLSGSQISFIAGVAAQAAAALEVARLYGEELARQRYREELATARRIQESLLPAEMPAIPGISISAISQPAQAVGGDYYDVIKLGDGRFLVTVADVSGKGLAASLYMAEFHGMVHVACGQHGSPRDILITLNEHLFEVITRGSFITATMLVFDTTRRSVSYARAGHTPIIRRSRSEVDALVPTGVALGLCSRELFAELLQEYTVEYEPGETFLLYSDGVSEAMNSERQEFGEGRLHDVIANVSDPNASMLRDRILTQVESFRDGAEQNDDVTIVVVQVDREAPERVNAERPYGVISQ